MTKNNNATEPQIPEEIWMLWVTYDDEEAGHWLSAHWLSALDEYCLTCCFSEEEAWRACVEQEEKCGIKTKPVRVK